MVMDIPVKKGYLLFPPQGVLSHIKKSWHKKYCELHTASKCGIERLEVFESEEDACTNLSPRIITLENCVKITPDPPKLESNVFVVVTRTSTYYFACVEEHEKSEWVAAFQFVAFKEIIGGPVIEEDNDLYCSSGEGVFLVKLIESDASARCGLEPGPYTLLLTSSAIQLREPKQQSLLVTWPYCYIRRYGYCDGRFTFEAGRMCDTGEGKFLVEHPNQQEIYKCLSLKMRSMKSMRKLLEGEANSASQLQVALNMEARSRSPIPPCPTSQDHHPAALRARAVSQGNLLENSQHRSPALETNPLVVINAPAHLKPRAFSASHGALDALSSPKSPTLFHAKVIDIEMPTESAPPLQPKIIKSLGKPAVPEKVIYWQRGKSGTSNKCADDYDDVEVRQEAWRTLGTDEPAHTEDYEPIEAVESTMRSTEAITCAQPVPPTRPKFLPIKPASEHGNYNTLQYIANAKSSINSAYKQIVISPTSTDSPVSPVSATLTFHDYDEVADHSPGVVSLGPIGQATRPADDSHQGYGIIRRLPDHRLFNNLEYALVTKPRQV